MIPADCKRKSSRRQIICAITPSELHAQRQAIDIGDRAALDKIGVYFRRKRETLSEVELVAQTDTEDEFILMLAELDTRRSDKPEIIIEMATYRNKYDIFPACILADKFDERSDSPVLRESKFVLDS